MQNKIFYIYRSSAGSGKTRALAKAYLKLALQFQEDYFRHILAVTFTNKATHEMKERILQYLDDFSKEKPNSLSKEIQNELQLTKEQLRKKSTILLSNILHQYGRFAVSTIDSFFQKVLRSFTQEAGLVGDFHLELESQWILREALEMVMDELGENKQLTEWVLAFSRDRLMTGKSLNILTALESFGKEIFKEQFQVIEDQLEKSLEKPHLLKEIKQLLQKEVAIFESNMQKKASKALSVIHEKNMTVDDFKYKDRGTPLKYFLSFSEKKYFESTGKQIQEGLDDGANWYTKKNGDIAKVDMTNKLLVPILRDMVNYDQTNCPRYFSADCVLKNFYAFGLIFDIVRKMKAYKQAHNLMLISDTPQFIQKIIRDSDVPFIYEKIGSYFRHYLIDEFQDTSGLQWKNFYPLLKDALDQGQSSFLVGDVKQSIYRWRGGDANLLQNEVVKSMGQNYVQIERLKTNYRSSDFIIQFNNMLFKRAAHIVANCTNPSFSEDIFDDVVQKKNNLFSNKGYIRISFPNKIENEKNWKEEVLERLPILIEELQDKKVRLGDIAILTRKKSEGQQVAKAFLQYKNKHIENGYRYDVVSDESLRIDAAPSVKLILSALRYLHDPHDAIVCAQLVYEAKKEKPLEEIFHYAKPSEINKVLPLELNQDKEQIVKLPMYEMTAELIRLFKLEQQEDQLTYIQAFQHVVLEFMAQKQNTLKAFLVWWEERKHKKSIPGGGDTDTINILTIHKAKGLQFKYVILPFLDWPLDHEKNKLSLWVKASKKPFDAMNHLVVSYNKKLEKTYFKDTYMLEKAKTYLDNLNLLYVSFTRSEEGLIVYAPRPTKPKEEPKTVGHLVYKTLLEEDSLKTDFDNNEFSMGTINPINESESKTQDSSIVLKKYSHFEWRKNLNFEPKHMVRAQNNEHTNSSLYGIRLHKVMAQLRYKDEATAVLETFCIQEMLTEEEKNKLVNEVKKIITHPIASLWFDRAWNVHTEKSILSPDGEQKRVDRIMITGDNIVLVDYKTGKKTTEDQKQVRAYIELLEQMNYTCTGYLLYSNSMEIISIK